MAILMLNLLIAVLGTVHDSVSQHAEVEFHLSRNQFIQRSAGVVNAGHLPPPLNVIMAASLIVIDVFGEFCYQLGLCPRIWPAAGHDHASAGAAAAAAVAGGSAGGSGGGEGSGGRDGRPTQGKTKLVARRPRKRLVGVTMPRAEIAPGVGPTASNVNDDGVIPSSGK